MSRPVAAWDVYKAIADPNRRIVLDVLARGEHSAGAIHARILLMQAGPEISQPALSQHLKVLREVGLVRQRRSGREQIYALNPKPLKEVSDWLRHYEDFWHGRLTALGEHLEKKHGRKK